MHKKSALILLSILLFWGCSTKSDEKLPKDLQELTNLTVYPGNEQPDYTINFKMKASYGNTKSALIGRIGGIAVDDSGRVFIVDSQQHTIHVYEPNGRYLTHIGRKGRGPGEFGFALSPKIFSNQLYIYDPTLLRIVIFSLDSLKVIHTINLDPISRNRIQKLAGFYIRQIFFRNNGSFLVCFAQLNTKPPKVAGQKIDDFHRLYYLMNNQGRLLPDQVYKQRDNIRLTGLINGRVQGAPFPFMGKPLIAFSNEGNIFSAWSQNFLIEIRDKNGKYLRSFYYSDKRVKMTEKDALNGLSNKEFQRILRQNELPKTWPALNAMKIDDQNRLWISTIVKNQKVYQWWVLTDQGKLLARFTWPRDKPIEVIKNGYLYTRETNKKTGMEQIVRYRIRMK